MRARKLGVEAPAPAADYQKTHKKILAALHKENKPSATGRIAQETGYAMSTVWEHLKDAQQQGAVRQLGGQPVRWEEQ